MKVTIINPQTGCALKEVENGLLDPNGKLFPLKKGVYRFTEEENYTSNFGYEWNKFTKTQIDAFSKSNQSRERFFKVTQWDKEDLAGQNILEVGSGAGRFSEVVLNNTEATLYSVDYSNATEANYRNNGHFEKLKLYQASIYELPFKEYSFDKVFCFGVLQHTPDFQKSIHCLSRMVKPGGELVVDFYPIRGFWTKINAKYFLRPFAKKMPHERLLKLIERNINWMIKTTTFFNRIGIGKIVNRFIPICDISGTLPKDLDESAIREWAILDTFDMFSPTYDNPQRISTVIKWMKDSGLENVTGGFVKYLDAQSAATVRGTRSKE